MPHDLTRPDPSVVLELLTAFRRSKTMFAAVKLGVFEALQSQPKSLPDLATELACSLDGLERLLDACVGLQLLQRTADLYANTPAASAYLTRTSPLRLTGYLNFSNDIMWELWSHLEDAVREGTHRWQQVYGWDGPIFASFFQNEDSKREFLMGMHGFGMISSPQVVSAIDLSGFHTLVDLGGATGHLAVAACQRYPHLNGIVFDLPEALPLARDMTQDTPVANRLQLVGGDFFTAPLPQGDLYALGRIIHDWSLEKSLQLLRRIYAALPPGGGVLLAEKLLDDSKTGPTWAQMQNLNMLTCTEGKERTLAEYEDLLTQAGFREITACRTSSPLDAILARKPAV